MRSKLEGMDTWDKIEEDQDGLALVKMLHDTTFHKDGSNQSMVELVEEDKSIYT